MMCHAVLMRKESNPAAKLKAAGSALPELRISARDDYEQEADRMAAAIDLTNTTRPPWSLSAVRRGTYSRERSAPAVSGNGTAGLGIAPPIVREVLNSPGRPLDRSKSAYFSGLYGFDFRDLRIHSDETAAASAKAVDAQAYTVGNHVVFDQGAYSPNSASGLRLLGHELTHVAQQNSHPILRRQPNSQSPQGGKIRPLVQKFIDGQATEQEKTALKQLLVSNQLNADEVDALQKYIGRAIADAVVKQAIPGAGQININTGGEVRDIHTFFKATLKLRLSGATKFLAGGLEGSLETIAEIRGDAGSKKVTISITAPEGETMLAAMVRAKVFPHGERSFELGEGFLKGLNMVSLTGVITILITGKKDTQSGGLVITSPDIPEDVQLEVALSQSEAKPALAPPTGAGALPPARAFVTGGVVADPKQTGAATTVGVDVPVVYDTANPLIYGAIGLRAGADTRGGLHGGASLATGLNLNRVTLQMAFDAGIARLPAGQTSAGIGPQTSAYFGAEASVGVQVSKHVQLMALASLIGGTNKEPSAGSVQVGAGFTF